MGYLVISGKELIQKLESKGGKQVKQVGSHVKFQLHNFITTIPTHGNDDLPKGTLKKICKDLQIDYDFIKS
ncbi:MAG: type II toxin-antitoxin system HicA family toxin [Candidatus Absconditabacterales bacterium]